MRTRLCSALMLSLALFAGQAAAQATPAAEPVTLATVTISGILPGPGLWKVSKGDHALWILGTLSPLPKNMEWESLQVERTLARSQQLLTSGGLTVSADIGLFRVMLLIPKALGARKNPDDQTLQELLPAPLYTRWLALKQKYLGNDRGIERWRPMFAAQELYSAALKQSGLRDDSQVLPKLRKLAKKQDIAVVDPMVTLKIADPKAALNELVETNLDDLDCFEKTLARIENDLPAMAERANAWAIGAMPAIRALPYQDQNASCVSAVLNTRLAEQYGMKDAPARIDAAWLKAAETALEKNASTVAVLSIAELLKPDGLLAILQARGYTVEAPR